MNEWKSVKYVHEDMANGPYCLEDMRDLVPIQTAFELLCDFYLNDICALKIIIQIKSYTSLFILRAPELSIQTSQNVEALMILLD